MPEGVEIKIQVNRLRPICKGKTIIGIEWNKSYQKNGVKNSEIFNLPLTVTDVWSRGKVIVFETTDPSGQTLYITSQLGMSGHWVSSPQKHSNLWFKFGIPHPQNNEYWLVTHTLWYDDQRHYGELGFYRDLSPVWKRHGPCLMTTVLVDKGVINEESLNTHQKRVPFDLYKEKIRNKRFKGDKRLAEYMMDQTRVSGVGNYLRAEILYQAKISPKRLLSSLTDTDIETLYSCTLDVMYRSYTDKGGYHVGTDCGSGFEKVVYKREHDPYGNPVVKFQDKDKRMCHYVPTVQI